MRAAVAGCIALLAATAARADLARIQITSDTDYERSVSALGTRIAWISGPLQHGDVFLFDAAHPRDPSAPLACPLSNPCRLTDDDADDRSPTLLDGGVLWRTASGIRFSDGATVAAIPGTAEPAIAFRASGSRAVWWGTDGVGAQGLFLFDANRAIDLGAPDACPTTNPCRVATGTASLGSDGPNIHGSRVVWAAIVPGESDSEIVLFDADRPAGAGPLATCPDTNPCLVTSNEVGDDFPDVSDRWITWIRCPESDCFSGLPDRVVFSDGETETEYPDDFVGYRVVSAGPWVVWDGPFGGAQVLDTRRPWDLTGANPQWLSGSYGLLLEDGRVLLDTQTDVADVPIELRFYDLNRPAGPFPFSACPDGNPCVAVPTGSLGSYDYSGDVIAWVECAPEVVSCYDDPTADLYYAVPEPPASIAGLTVLLALLGARRRH
jgi:hypothetical protein